MADAAAKILNPAKVTVGMANKFSMPAGFSFLPSVSSGTGIWTSGMKKTAKTPAIRRRQPMMINGRMNPPTYHKKTLYFHRCHGSYDHGRGDKLPWLGSYLEQATTDGRSNNQTQTCCCFHVGLQNVNNNQAITCQFKLRACMHANVKWQ